MFPSRSATEGKMCTLRLRRDCRDLLRAVDSATLIRADLKITPLAHRG
jgi:hypothetical protein